MNAKDVAWIDLKNATPEQREAQISFMRHMSILMYSISGVLLLAAVAVPKADTSDHPWDIGLAAALFAWALLMWVVRRPPEWLLQAGVLYSITTLSILMGAARPIGATPFFYLWPIVSCAFSFSRRMLWLAIAWMTATLGVALAFFAVGPIKGVMFWSIVTCVSFMGVMISVLRDRALVLVRELELASTTDPLTGLLNRRAFGLAFERDIERAVADERPLSVAVFDLDYFKALNDELGHAGGDEALRAFARVLTSACRPGDVVARMGGEEFAVVLFGAGPEEAERIAERVGQRLREESVGGETPMSVSAGVATLDHGASSPDRLLLLADKALYGAKDAGRSRVAHWDGGVIVGQPQPGLSAAA